MNHRPPPLGTEYVVRFRGFAPILDGADHVDVKTVVGRIDLPEFLAALLSYQPAWLTLLYRVRMGLVLLLGLPRNGGPRARAIRPDLVPMTPGASISFWTVRSVEDRRFWAAETPPARHLAAHLAVAAEPLCDGRTRFHVATVVHYRHWTGPVYFNLIRPFHHMVVRRTARHAAQGFRSPEPETR